MLDSETGKRPPFLLTIIVSVLATLTLLSPTLTLAAPGDESRPQEAPFFGGGFDDDDDSPRLPFQPRNRGNSDEDNRSGRPFPKRKQLNSGPSKSISNNERFGKPKDKIVFKLVDDEEIKQKLRERKLKGEELSQAPLLEKSN